MIRRNSHQFSSTLLLASLALLIGLLATTAAPALAQTSGNWTKTAGMNTARASQTAAYAETYNTSTGTWTLDGGNSTPGNTGQTVTLLGTGMVLTAGGTQGVYPRKITVPSACDLFDPSTGNDVLTGSMHTARDHHTATVLQNGQVLAAGGESQDRKGNLFYTNTAELYTP